MATHTSNEGRVIIKMSVRIPDGREGTIHVFPDDDPRELAQKFCKKYGILERIDIVERHIADNMSTLMPPSAAAPPHRPPRGKPASANGDAAAHIAPYTHPDRAAGLPNPPRAISTLSEPDLPRNTRIPPEATPAYAAAAPYTDALPAPPPSVGSGSATPARDSLRRRSERWQSEARSETSSADPFEASSPFGVASRRPSLDGAAAALGASDLSPAAMAEVGVRRKASGGDFGKARVGSSAFLRRTAVHWREREADKGRLRTVWLAMRLHAMLAREERKAEAREREMEELHMANSRIGELAFKAATGDAAAAEAQRRAVLTSLAPNYAARKAEELARKAEGAAAVLAERCERMAGSVGAKAVAERERRVLQDVWGRWVAAEGERRESAAQGERRERERVEEELRAVKISLAKKEKECEDLIQMCVQSKLTSAELYSDALSSANALHKIRTSSRISAADCDAIISSSRISHSSSRLAP